MNSARMSLVFMLTVLCFGAAFFTTAIGESIKIYPKQEYFGGSNTQVVIACQPTSSCGDTIKWFFGTTQISDISPYYSMYVNLANHHQTLVIINADETVAGSYHCQCSFNGVAVNSPDSTLTHVEPVSFSTPDNEVYYTEYGNSVTLPCEIENYGEFQWQFEDNSIIPSNTNKYSYVNGTYLLINNLTDSDNKTVYCVGNNQVTFIAKIAAHVFVYKPPKVVVTNVTDITIVEGETVIVNCTATGHPVPSISWNKIGEPLKTGNTIIQKKGTIDQYTTWSSLTLTHVSTSDGGSYLCSGNNMTPKKTASASDTFTLTVKEPAEPFFDIFAIDKSHSSINISWILSGTSSDMINISWSSSEGGVHQIHNTSLNSVAITDLVPATIYTITAVVINTQLTATLNESTDPLTVITPSESSSTMIESSASSTLDTTSSVSPSTRAVVVTKTSINRRPPITNLRRVTSTQPQYLPTETSPTTEPTLTVRDSSTGFGSVTTTVPLVVCVLLVIIVVAVVLMVVCVIRRSRNSSSKNIRSIEGGRSSSRMSQGLLDSTFASPHRSYSIQSSTSIIPSDFSDMKKMPLPPDYYPPSSNQGSQVKLHPMENRPFEMTDNIVNSEYELSQVQMNITPPTTSNEYFTDCPAYPGDSVSQVIPVSHSQNQLLDYHSQNDQFEYTDNSIYEGVNIKKSQLEPPSRQSGSKSNKLTPVYKNLPTKQPEFGIVGNGQRGAVRENVVIKKRS